MSLSFAIPTTIHGSFRRWPSCRTCVLLYSLIAGLQVRESEREREREKEREREGLDEEIEGHRWTISATSFGCKRCWAKIPLRSGKAALTSMQQSVCLYGPKTEAELGLRSRVHTTHEIWRRGAWLECKRCGRTTKEIQGKVQTWLSQLCQKGGGQRTLQFVQHSSES